MIISIANQKGGVGKTTTTLNIGAGLVNAGKKVLLIDLDPQSNLTSYLDYQKDNKPTMADIMLSICENKPLNIKEIIRHNKEGMDYIPSNIILASADLFLATAFMREHMLSKLLKDPYFEIYDYILIDCLPSLGILLTNALIASDKLLIPVQAELFALDGVEYLVGIYEMIKSSANPNLEILGFLITMYDRSNMSKAVDEALRQQFGALVLECKTRDYKEAPKSTYEKVSLVNTKNSRLGEDYLKITQEILEKIGG